MTAGYRSIRRASPGMKVCGTCDGGRAVRGGCNARVPASRCYGDCNGCFKLETCDTCHGAGEVEKLCADCGERIGPALDGDLCMVCTVALAMEAR